MIKLVTVDDEEIIRQGLRVILHWEDYGIEIAGEAADARQAADLIRRTKPELLICDVRMPGLSGLDLIRGLRSEGYVGKIVILSGYDDFAYVKEALRYGVENYLLKPVDRDELAQTVEEAVRKIDRGLSGTDSRDFRGTLLARLLREGISHAEFREKAAALGLDFLDLRMRVALIEPIAEDSRPLFGQGLETRPGGGPLIEAFIDADGRPVLLLKAEEPDAWERFLPVFLAELRGKSGRDDLAASVGGTAVSYRELSRSYSEAMEIRDYLHIDGSMEVVCYDEIASKRAAADWRAFFDQNGFEAVLRSGDSVRTAAFLGEVFSSVRNPGSTLSMVKELALEAAMSAFRIMRAAGAQSEAHNPGRFVRWLLETRDTAQIENGLRELAGFTCAYTRKHDERRYSKLVTAMMAHVRAHLAEPLSLKVLSQLMQHNAAYMGKVFRDETGENFTDYLTRIRVERARELLVDEGLKISEVAASAGFENANYFYAVFKKSLGMTPSEYRESRALTAKSAGVQTINHL